MKIIKVSSFFWPVYGGMENHLYYEGREFLKLGHDFRIFTSDSKRKEGKILRKEEIIDGLKVKRFPTWLMLSAFTPICPALLKSVLTEDYDVLHVHSYRQFHNFAVLLGKLRGKPVVLSTHWPEYPDSARSKLLNKFIKIYDKTIGPFILNAADKLVVQTEAEKLWLQEKFKINPEKVEIIPPGFHSFYLDARDGKKFREKYKIKEKFIVLLIGRLHKSKGFDKIIKIAGGFRDVKFVLVGPDGGYRKDFEKLACDMHVENKVLFTGEVSEQEKIDALAACDVLAMPSDYEAFGISLIEAFAHGKPVIATNAGGMPHVVGDCGFVFEKDNLEDLKEKLQMLLSDKKLREELGKKAKERARNYTWEKLARDLEKVYAKLI